MPEEVPSPVRFRQVCISRIFPLALTLLLLLLDQTSQPPTLFLPLPIQNNTQHLPCREEVLLLRHTLPFPKYLFFLREEKHLIYNPFFSSFNFFRPKNIDFIIGLLVGHAYSQQPHFIQLLRLYLLSILL